MKLDDALRDGMSVDGAIGIALVDMRSGMLLGKQGGNQLFDLEMAGALNTEVLRAKLRAVEALQLGDSVQDILVTLGAQYHLIMPLIRNDGEELFLYLALDKARGNLALARHQLRRIEQAIRL
ncbi:MULTISPECIES: hypothetical protein [Nocardia]|uniref:Roadblock/LC7 domain-containing protein n=1 Tax=Nocardia jiangsuensis TaxID=1691563 RepID=A0ABV8DQY0_9NOCA|nr:MULTISPECIES: hypothetical protein [Nocardia]UGT61081.1 hypothetical protein LTT61_28740 [Nocardia asteroides]